jgi:hypothetical protein
MKNDEKYIKFHLLVKGSNLFTFFKYNYNCSSGKCTFDIINNNNNDGEVIVLPNLQKRINNGDINIQTNLYTFSSGTRSGLKKFFVSFHITNIIIVNKNLSYNWFCIQ